MFTTDSGYGWKTSPKPLSTIAYRDRPDWPVQVLTPRGVADFVARLASGMGHDEALDAVRKRDFGHDVMGWWTYRGRRNPWRMVGRVQITRTVEWGAVHYCATSMICDHTSHTLAHLLGRLIRMSAGSAKREREKKARKGKGRRPARVLSDGELWARRAEDGWGPGGY